MLKQWRGLALLYLLYLLTLATYDTFSWIKDLYVGLALSALQCLVCKHYQCACIIKYCDADEQHGPDKECDKVPADNSKNVNSDNEPHNANKVPADNSKNVNSDNEPHNANKVPADNSKNVNSDNESHNANTNLTSESASPPEIMQRSPSNCSSSSFLGHQ